MCEVALKKRLGPILPVVPAYGVLLLFKSTLKIPVKILGQGDVNTQEEEK